MLNKAVAWRSKQGLEFDAVNKNLPDVDEFGSDISMTVIPGVTGNPKRRSYIFVMGSSADSTMMSAF